MEMAIEKLERRRRCSEGDRCLDENTISPGWRSRLSRASSRRRKRKGGPVDIIRYNVAPSDIICSRAVNSTPVSINLDSISTKRGFMFSAPCRGRRALSYPVEPVFGELVSFPQPLLFSLFLFILLTLVFYRLICRKRKIYKHVRIS